MPAVARRLEALAGQLRPLARPPAVEGTADEQQSRPAPPKNLLMIITDDQGWWSLGCYGNAEVATPHLDGLAASGWRFDNMLCVSPVCSPARASLLTGRIPSQHGIHDWLAGGNTPAETADGALVEYLEGQTGYSDVLAAHGFDCGLSGKWHMGNSHKPQKGFRFWRPHTKGGGPYYQAPMVSVAPGTGHRAPDLVDGTRTYEAEQYVTDVFTDTALEFLRQDRGASAPWCLYVGYTAPHSPWGREHHPKDLWDKYHDTCPFETSVPPFGLPKAPWIEHVSIPVPTAEKRRENLAGYYASIEAMDAGVGRLLAELEATGQREDTLICFTSDNGMNMGHHGVYGKGNATYPMNMYEESVRVPFIMSHPRSMRAGVGCKALLSHYDFLPTLLDLLGLDPLPAQEAAALPGRSFAPLLRGEVTTAEPEGSAVVYDEYGHVRMIRSEEWKYPHR